VIYGDPAYGRQQYLLSPLKGSRLTAQQERFNAAMSKVRICVKWEFGRLVQYWAFCDHARNQKLQLQPVGTTYKVAVLLANVWTCMNTGTQTSKFFGLSPPSVEEYLLTAN
ncbi:TPA: hypothetical protein N0F65_000951, partial [Lagenidium giganteum]